MYVCVFLSVRLRLRLRLRVRVRVFVRVPVRVRVCVRVRILCACVINHMQCSHFRLAAEVVVAGEVEAAVAEAVAEAVAVEMQVESSATRSSWGVCLRRLMTMISVPISRLLESSLIVK